MLSFNSEVTDGDYMGTLARIFHAQSLNCGLYVDGTA